MSTTNEAKSMNGRSAGVVMACVALALAGVLASPVRLQAQEKKGRSIVLAVGDIKDAPLTFAVRSYHAAEADVVEVRAEVGVQRLTLTGKKEGATDVQVLGEGQSAETIRVVVLPNIDAARNAIANELDQMPEVEVSLSLGRVMLRGEINIPERWVEVKTLVKAYGALVNDRTTFAPLPELILRLKGALTDVGRFKIAEGLKAVSTQEPGTLTIARMNNGIVISGSVYSRNDIARVTSIVQAQHWLTVKQDADRDRETDSIPAILNLSVVPVMLEVDVAFMGVTDVEEQQIGANIAKAGLLFVRAAASTASSYVKGEGTEKTTASSYVIGTDLSGSLQFFAASGPGRMKTVGHMSFLNDSAKGGKFQSGGTLLIRTQGTSGGGDIQKVDYGLLLDAKGGLVDSATAALETDVELSTPVPIGQDYDLKKNRITTTLYCPVGKTLVMAGTQDLFEGVRKEGVPILRDVPILRWFFSEKGKRLENRRLIILISPQLAPAPQLAAPVSAETVKTQEDANTPVEERNR